MARTKITLHLSDEQIKVGYNRTLPVMWYFKAQNLLDAAKILESHDKLFDQIRTQNKFSDTKLDLISVILMLRGMAIECLLKGALTIQGKIRVKDGRLDLVDKYKKHNLEIMAKDLIGLNLEKDEYITLKTLSQQITLARLPLNKAPSKEQMTQGAWDLPHDEEVYLNILDKILALNDKLSVKTD
jgi:hypothetical protein